MSTSASFLLSPRELPSAELQTARLDGDLVGYGAGDRYCPIDISTTVDAAGRRQLRAASLEHLVPRALVAELSTAAWLHGAWPRLRLPLEVCVRSDHRVRAAASPTTSVRQVVLADGDLMTVGDLLVTTPLRTAIDLLRLSLDFDRRLAVVIGTLLLMAGDGAARAETILRRSPHLPHKRRALERLETLQGLRDQPPDTR
jgi:hypothetical protein